MATSREKSKVSVRSADTSSASSSEKETVKTETAEKKQYKVRNQLSPNTVVTVKNGFPGPLTYKSRKTGERFHWDGLGSEQDMELQELRQARNSDKCFFENNWFMINDPAVISYLGVEKYYENAIDITGFDDLFALSPEDVKSKISRLSDGQRLIVAYRAKQLISDGDIDSIKVINALEECLGIELIEK